MKNTRDNILKAAVVVWGQDYNAPLKEIAKQAGISRMTLHRHFCGRESILQAVAVLFFEKLVSALDEAQNTKEHPIKQMEVLVHEVHLLGLEYNFMFDLFEQKGYPDSLLEKFQTWDGMFAQFFQRLQEQDLVKAHVTSEWADSMFEGVMKAGFRMTLNHAAEPQNLFELMWDAYCSAIFKPEAMAKYHDSMDLNTDQN